MNVGAFVVATLGASSMVAMAASVQSARRNAARAYTMTRVTGTRHRLTPRARQRLILVPVTVAVSLFVAHFDMALIALICGAFGLYATKTIRKRRALQIYESRLPHLLDDLARSVSAGAGMLQALKTSSKRIDGQLGADLAGVVDRAEAGASLVDALQGWRSSANNSIAVRFATGAIALALTTGASHAAALDAAATAARQQQRTTALAVTHATQARVSAWVLATLPLVLLVPSLVANGGVRQFVFHSHAGFTTIALGLGLDAAGAAWMMAAIRRVAR